MDGSGLTEAEGGVRRRRVFYIPGYDPFRRAATASFTAREGAEQAAISGYELAVGRGPGQAKDAWRVKARIDRREVLSDVEVLVWSDLVRGLDGPEHPAPMCSLLRTAGSISARARCSG